MPDDLRDALQLEGPQEHDLVIDHTTVISCVVIDGNGDSWVMPYHRLGPSRFLDGKFELYFGEHVVAVTVVDPQSTALEQALQAIPQWRLSLIAHGERFRIRVGLAT